MSGFPMVWLVYLAELNDRAGKFAACLGVMQTFAAIDIGSNSCRLKIGRVVQHKLRVVHEDREVTRLGASVFESGIVSPEAMAATLRTLKRFYKAVQSNGADRVRGVASSARGDAAN